MNQERKIVFLAFMMMLWNTVDFMLVMPLSPYFITQLHTPVVLIGSIVGIYTLCSAVSSVAFSRFVDKTARKKAIIFSLGGLVISTALTASAWNTESLFVFRLLAGIFGGPVTALASTIVTDYVPVERRGRAMGILMSSFSISSAIAIPLAIFIATHTHWRFSFLLISVVIIMLITYVIFAFKQPFKQTFATQQNTLIKTLLKERVVWISFLSIGISMGTLFALIPNFANFFVMNRGIHVSDLSLLYLYGGIGSILGAIIGGRLTDKIGPISVCFIGTLLAGAALVATINFDLIAVGLFYFLMMGAASLRMTSVMTQISELPEPSQRGAFMSLQNAIRNLMMAIGAAASGLFLSTAPDGTLKGMGTLAIIAAIAGFFVPVIMFYIAGFLQRRGKAY